MARLLSSHPVTQGTQLVSGPCSFVFDLLSDDPTANSESLLDTSLDAARLYAITASEVEIAREAWTEVDQLMMAWRWAIDSRIPVTECDTAGVSLAACAAWLGGAERWLERAVVGWREPADRQMAVGATTNEYDTTPDLVEPAPRPELEALLAEREVSTVTCQRCNWILLRDSRIGTKCSEMCRYQA
ncbi:unnamed protein product [Protopolystoma xenopodis]|uniref:Uncharacterized protein n=1 Tax=Protopolystoma xenopodis TaxID=117903 RepID=A0A3S5BUQ8_9PLAT|nr:unnamed protein product [Protopolystoma xenopodis]